jgi:hypothetical protein
MPIGAPVDKPAFGFGARVGRGQPVAFLDELQDIIRRDAGWDFGKGRSLLGATWRHGQQKYGFGNSSTAWPVSHPLCPLLASRLGAGALIAAPVSHSDGGVEFTSHGSSHDRPSPGCWDDILQKVPGFIGLVVWSSAFAVCLKRSTQILQLSTKTSADYPI